MVVLCLLINACGGDELDESDGEEKPDGVFYKNPSFKIVGKYDLLSYLTQKPMDLNFDGKYSHNLFDEMGNYYWQEAHRFYLHIYNDLYPREDGTTEYVPIIDLYAPYANVRSDAETGEYLYTLYGVANCSARFYFSEKKNEFTIIDPSLGEGQLVAVSIDEDILFATFRRYFYTDPQFLFTDDGWEKITIHATYKKRPE